MKVVISEYAPFRSHALLHWFPDATVCRRYKEEQLPNSFDLLILSGGPYSANKESRLQYPFLEEDLVLLRKLQTTGDSAPFVLGICLGAQLMAFALNGHVKNGIKGDDVVGWNHIEIVGNHKAFKGIKSLLACEIHNNHIIQLPSKATLIASSQFDEIEAFAVGDRFLATAFHPEITKNDVEWFSTNAGIKLSTICESKFSVEDAYIASEMFFKNIITLV